MRTLAHLLDMEGIIFREKVTVVIILALLLFFWGWLIYVLHNGEGE